MMKSKQFLRSLVRSGLPLKIFILLSIIFLFGCTPYKQNTISQENIGQNIQDICKEKYDISVKTKIVGQTLWIYLPLEDMIEKAEKEEKFVERFEIKNIDTKFEETSIQLDYAITQIPEQEKSHQVAYSKEAKKKINNVWKAIHGILFKTKHSYIEGIQFFCFVIADIKNGFEVKQIAYMPDLKRISYGIINGMEFHHRTINEDLNMSFDIIGDREGTHLDYRDISLKEFITAQIKQRIKQKFSRPEVRTNVDIEKEVMKIVIYVLKIYDFKDFSDVEFNNILTGKNEVLGKTLIWENSIN